MAAPPLILHLAAPPLIITLSFSYHFNRIPFGRAGASSIPSGFLSSFSAADRARARPFTNFRLIAARTRFDHPEDSNEAVERATDDHPADETINCARKSRVKREKTGRSRASPFDPSRGNAPHVHSRARTHNTNTNTHADVCIHTRAQMHTAYAAYISIALLGAECFIGG